jgi:hypothetical protein
MLKYVFFVCLSMETNICFHPWPKYTSLSLPLIPRPQICFHRTITSNNLLNKKNVFLNMMRREL